MPCYICSHCGKCGMFDHSVQLECAECGAQIEPGAERCPECGASTANAKVKVPLDLGRPHVPLRR